MHGGDRNSGRSWWQYRQEKMQIAWELGYSSVVWEICPQAGGQMYPKYVTHVKGKEKWEKENSYICPMQGQNFGENLNSIVKFCPCKRGKQ